MWRRGGRRSAGRGVVPVDISCGVGSRPSGGRFRKQVGFGESLVRGGFVGAVASADRTIAGFPNLWISRFISLGARADWSVPRGACYGVQEVAREDRISRRLRSERGRWPGAGSAGKHDGKKETDFPGGESAVGYGRRGPRRRRLQFVTESETVQYLDTVLADPSRRARLTPYVWWRTRWKKLSTAASPLRKWAVS